MRGENPYFRIPGAFSITADHWMLRGVDQGAGTRGSCVIEEDLYNQYFNLSALTFDGQGEPMRMEALALNLPYNREECYVSIPLGQLLATFEEKDMMVYLVAINVKNSTFTTGSGAVTGVVSDDFRTITLHGLPEEYQTLGLISRKISDTSQVGMFGDIYYPSGEGIVLAREAASASPASLPVAFSSVQRGGCAPTRPAGSTGSSSSIDAETLKQRADETIISCYKWFGGRRSAAGGMRGRYDRARRRSRRTGGYDAQRDVGQPALFGTGGEGNVALQDARRRGRILRRDQCRDMELHQRQRGVARSGAERIRRYADAPRPAERGGVGTRRRGGRDGGRRVRRADVDGGGRAERGRNARNRGDAQSGADSGLRIAAERFDRNRLQL